MVVFRCWGGEEERRRGVEFDVVRSFLRSFKVLLKWHKELISEGQRIATD